MNTKDFFKGLEDKIQSAYTDGVTLDQAEKLAGEFLHAQMVINHELSHYGLDARMRKSGLKAIKAAVYLGEVQKADKKPTEAMLTAIIDTNGLVSEEQEKLDQAEVTVDELERYYNIFQQAHVYFRQMSKGSFNG